MMQENQAPEPVIDGNPKLKCGYLVGVSEDGTLIFRPVGSTLGIVELLGLHGYAGHRLKTVLDVNQGTGDAITMNVLQLLEKELTVDNNKQTVDEPGDAKGAN